MSILAQHSLVSQKTLETDRLALFSFSKGGRSMEPSDVNEQSQGVRLADSTAPAPQDVPKQSVRWTTDTIIVNGNPLTILFPESD